MFDTRFDTSPIGTYGDVAPLPPPPRPPDPRRRRRRRVRRAVVLVVLAAVVALVGSLLAGRFLGGTGLRSTYPGAYTAAPDRTAVHIGGDSYSDAEVQAIGANAGYMVIPKFADNSDVHAQFADAARIVAAGRAHGNDVKVLAYVNSTWWYPDNAAGWRPWSSSFRPSWFLRDAHGNRIPLLPTKANGRSSTPTAWMVDLGNAALRRWLVSTITDWMQAAPFAGVNLDSADPLVGGDPSGWTTKGSTTVNEALCGGSAHTDASGNCPRVTAWNTGLRELVSETVAALHPRGDVVAYNGVAPSPRRPADRNQGLLQVADMANNESFCLQSTPAAPDKVVFTDVTADIAMMRDQAAAGKDITEITNYHTADKKAFGAYCLGAFLMGWQPGHDWWAFQEGYASEGGTIPVLPEQNLALGAPTTTDHRTDGTVLSRTFQHGLVAVNTGTHDGTVTVPTGMVRFEGGRAVGRVAAGDEVTVGGRQAVFLLSDAFLAGPSGSKPAGS